GHPRVPPEYNPWPRPAIEAPPAARLLWAYRPAEPIESRKSLRPERSGWFHLKWQLLRLVLADLPALIRGPNARSAPHPLPDTHRRRYAPSGRQSQVLSRCAEFSRDGAAELQICRRMAVQLRLHDPRHRE